MGWLRMSRRQRSRRSAGTVMPWDLGRNRMRGPDAAALAADMEAIDRGESRTLFCSFRGLYGSYPGKFRGYLVDLTRDGIILRPLLGLQFLRRQSQVREVVLSAWERPFADVHEARQLQATGLYGPGGALEWAGSSVVSCRTSEGVLEFAVRRPDVQLLLRYLSVLAARDAGQAC